MSQPNNLFVEIYGFQITTETYKSIAVLFAFLYAITLSQLPNDQFKDFVNYLNYAEDSDLIIINRLGNGIIPMLANEPVWLLVNAGLKIFFQPETVVRLIIFFSSFVVALTIFLAKPKYFLWLILFLLLPSVVKNHIIHLRQGFALAFFLVGWFSTSLSLRWLLIGLSPLLHSSFLFVLVILILSKLMLIFRFESFTRAVIFTLFGIIVSTNLDLLASLSQARQADEYVFSKTQVSGMGFLLWLLILNLFSLSSKKFLKKYSFEINIIIFYLSTYWLMEVTARIFESGLLLVLISGLAMTGWRLTTFKFTVVFVLFVVGWFFRIGEPSLGYGLN
jgi:hypothetical protein